MSRAPLLLGVDIGTTGCTTLLISAEGELLARETAWYPTYSPEPTWAEQKAEDWWTGTVTTVQACLQHVDPARQEVVGIGVDSHLEAFVPLDDQGNPLANGFLWIDRRTVPQARRMKEMISDQWVRRLTGVPINHVNPAAKILWVKENIPSAYEHARIFLSPKDYIVFKLTGQQVTDYSIASKTMLFSLYEPRWLEEVCKPLGIDVNKLPPAMGAWEMAGTVSTEAARLCGLKAGTPVAAGGGDDHCQSLGGGMVLPGEANIGTGTGCCWKAIIAQPKPDMQGAVECHFNIVPDTWIYWTGINATGFSVSWFITNFFGPGGEERFAEFERLAASVPPGARDVFYYPHLWGARVPRFNPQASGVFFGFSNTHEKAHFCRAVLEGVAFQYQAILDILKGLGTVPKRISMVGGEVANALWNQIKADIIGMDILIPTIDDGSPLGAAMLAGLASGLYADASEAVRRVINWREVIHPDPERHAAYREIYRRYAAVYDVIEPAYAQLSTIY